MADPYLVGAVLVLAGIAAVVVVYAAVVLAARTDREHARLREERDAAERKGRGDG